MANWEDLSESEREEANLIAWDAATQRLRDAVNHNPSLSLDEARQAAFDEIERYVKEENRLIARAKRSRATQADRRFAANSERRIFEYALEQGFIFDVEI